MTQPMLLEPASPLPAPARLGEVLGKYRLDGIVATGGMGVVVEATHVHLDQRVAIKFLAPELAGDETLVHRFLQEARAAALLSSDHVVRVFDVDTLPTGTPYIVMEFLEGEDLEAMLERRGWLPPSEAVDYVLQTCEAIAEAHLVGIVHRDLKPGNLFHCKRADRLPFVKVLDFGVSKLLPTSHVAWKGNAATGPHVVMGTPLYASPEQLRSSTLVDARTDIWALGVILYELIAGRPPFLASTLLELRAKIAHGWLEPLRSLRPEVAEGLDAAVSKCLAKEPRDRFTTVADLAEALAPSAPRSAQLSVQRVENILRPPGSMDRTLPSATGRGLTPIPPSVVCTKQAPRPPSLPRRALRWVAGGVVCGGLVAAWMGSAPPHDERPQLRSGATAVVTPAAPGSTLAAPSASSPPTAPAAPVATASASPAQPTRARRSRQAPGTEGFGGLL